MTNIIKHSSRNIHLKQKVIRRKSTRFNFEFHELLFFIVFGMIIIGIGTLWLVNSPDEYFETMAVVTNVQSYYKDDEKKYDVTFKYYYDDVKYTSSFTDSNTQYTIGEEFPLYVDPDNPANISTTPYTKQISVVLLIIGAITIGASVIKYTRSYRTPFLISTRLPHFTTGR